MALKADVTRLLTSTLPIAVDDGKHDRALVDALGQHALGQRLAADRRRRRILAGVADAAAVEDGAVEGVGGCDRNAVLLGRLDDVVIGADLRRGHDQAVDRRILDDLVQDLDLALRVVGRRFGAEQQDLGADQVAGDRRADIDRVEEAVAGRVGDDREGQMTVGGMEVLGAVRLLGGILEAVAADRLGDGAGPLGVHRGDRQCRHCRCANRGDNSPHRNRPPSFSTLFSRPLPSTDDAQETGARQCKRNRSCLRTLA